MQKSAVWFRQDLRVDDNSALLAACKNDTTQVTAIFLATPQQWMAHDMADVRRDYLYAQLGTLRERLTELNIPLVYAEVETFADVPGWLTRTLKELQINALYANREYGWNEKKRDANVARELAHYGIQFTLNDDQAVIAPGLTTGKGSPYTVYTPFKRRWLETFRAAPKLPNGIPAARNNQTMGVHIGADLPQVPENPSWPPGEPAAHTKLKTYCREKIHDYARTRDLPAVDGTSSLSAELCAGVLSTRHCLAAALDANDGNLSDGDPGIDTWISELIWRDFYIHILDSFPEVSRHRAFRKETEFIRWRQSDTDFQAWCEGRTGIPIVDAAMRQLVTTGWMHNRLRMICAMFFSKHLLLDWRRGEQFFMRHLIDGHLASNNGGWQWAASTGTDAAPYFRIFNPVTQSKRFDTDGVFIKRYLPELSPFSAKDIHLPPAEQLIDMQIDYPPPIVDLSHGRTRALEAFKSVPDTKEIGRLQTG